MSKARLCPYDGQRARYSVASQGLPTGVVQTDVCARCLENEVRYRLQYAENVLVEKVMRDER